MRNRIRATYNDQLKMFVKRKNANEDTVYAALTLTNALFVK